jgi:GT2 family glycosyltransferase
MGDAAKVGVVTVTYNSGPVLDLFLQSLSSQTYDNFVLYAVDNASRDTSVAQLRAWGDPRLRIIANTANVGVAEGNNQGTRSALAEGCSYVLYLNNDIEFERDTFAILFNEIDDLGCDLLAPKILYEDRIRIWSAGGGFSAPKGYLGFHTGADEPDSGQFETARRIEHSPTCCLLVRRAVFERIGLMDERYFVYQDDSDFSFRAWKAGLIMFYTPRARIFHKVSYLTGGASSAFSLRYNARNHVYFMLKNLGPMRCLYYLPALQLRLLYKVCRRQISRAEFLIRQRALFEGISVWANRRNTLSAGDAQGA